MAPGVFGNYITRTDALYDAASLIYDAAFDVKKSDVSALFYYARPVAALIW